MSGVFKPLFFEPARHLLAMWGNDAYRRWAILGSRYGRVARYTPVEIALHGWKLTVPDVASFLSAYKEIFVEEVYRFPFAGRAPRILDLGANIGLATLYLKQAYPLAKITAVEADPSIFEILTRNVHGNGFNDVELVNAAAWDAEDSLTFLPDGADGGRLGDDPGLNSCKVRTIDMARFLEGRRYDFLKIDIEGAECRVLPACKELFPELGAVFVEYHSRFGEPQCLDALIALLAEYGFRLRIQSLAVGSPTFGRWDGREGFDMQLNISGWKS